MTYAPNASKEYLKNAVMTASSEQLHLMLLDGAIRFATQGQAAIAAVDAEATFNALDRAQRIVLELSSGLRRDVNPLLVDRMTALYGFIYRRLIDGGLHRDGKAVEEALRILRHQRETWVLLVEKLKREGPHLVEPDPTPQPAVATSSPESRFVAEG
jgi:flagellar protein FliS